MKIVYCVRHAKSSWADLSLSDLQRPLNKRGNRDAPRMAKHLQKMMPTCDLMLLSPSQRTRQTSAYFAKVLKVKRKSIIDKIYHASTDTLIETIAEIENEVNSAILFGHNPGMTYLYNYFAAGGIDNLPTCGFFRLSIDAPNWSDIYTTNTKADFLRYPKLLF